MTTQNNNSIYVLICEVNGQKIPFYVGRSHNIKQRARQHARAAMDTTHKEYNTYKYQLIRELEHHGDRWWLEELYKPEEVTDKTDEYCAILEAARVNTENGYGRVFWGNPLTNMKAGDFLSEMLADKNLHVYNRDTVNDWIQRRNAETVTYERENQAPMRNQALFDAMQEKSREMRRREQEKVDKKIERLEREIRELEKMRPLRDATISEKTQELNKLRGFNNFFDEK